VVLPLLTAPAVLWQTGLTVPSKGVFASASTSAVARSFMPEYYLENGFYKERQRI
jgi:hypothetical protein